MPHTNDNPRFQLLINGEPRATAGLELLGVLHVSVQWVLRDPREAPEKRKSTPEFNERDWICNRVTVDLGGLDSATDEHVKWLSSELRVGDEVTIRVLAPGEVDLPPTRYPVDHSFPPLSRTSDSTRKAAKRARKRRS